MTIRWKPVVTGVVLAGLVGGVGYAVQQKLSPPAATQPGGPPGGGPPPGPGGPRNSVVAVQAGTVAREDVPIWFDGIGTVQAFNSVTVRARVDGELQRVSLQEGQLVKAGDLLATIDSRPLQAQLAQAQAKKAQDEAQLANARRDLERNMNLKEFASRQSVDTQRALVAQYEAQIRADEAAIEAVQVQLNYTTVTAPLSGRIGLRNVDQGNVVRASDQNGIATITQIQPIAVLFTLPEKQLQAVLAAQAQGMVTVEAQDREGRRVLDTGKLSVVDNLIDSGTGTIRLKAEMPNDPQKLWPGQFVNVRLLSTVRRGATTVPSTVVQRGPQGTYAYVIKDDLTVEQRPIKVARQEETKAIVEEGLTPGERVVVDGQYRLQPGSKIRIVEPIASAAPTGSAPATVAPEAAPANRPAGQPQDPAAREERRRERQQQRENNGGAPPGQPGPREGRQPS
ncbi:efflux RND transporter periplasmic adaptor subunit [Azospirillum melinis]|uniref:Efflux RND transporter periplasmic adaptor subunit n=1 Tax=Azospirillum melinis TaxID=328839 RepID=A0ABX2KJ19_9PROT|nr:efflux RND transporter periplasmic adaptor subunit [Azospirillum melinis]MBP2309961.1 multidrug efflux system membrane fusion protein [Azospirillum melinis]NUB02736.1 efflux RND transporter periplasmic adaptor subunit [Azospirillum melinis]